MSRDRLNRVSRFMSEEFGYISIQSTRPSTLGAALADSPVGQLAWIVDKFREWTHPREALPHDVVGIDRLLTNVMLYWLTDTASSSAYVGYMQESSWGAAKSASGIPTAVIVFAHDVGIRRYAEPEHANHAVDRRRPWRSLRRTRRARDLDRGHPGVLRRTPLSGTRRTRRPRASGPASSSTVLRQLPIPATSWAMPASRVWAAETTP
nr:hypothetical protein GCM10017611_28590 [Rhodococcus wratislaviensis]